MTKELGGRPTKDQTGEYVAKRYAKKGEGIVRDPVTGKRIPTKEFLDNSVKKGEVRNPWGSYGKDGLPPFNLKKQLQKSLNMMNQKERDAFFYGLIMKAKEGDVNAIKLCALLNNEKLEDNKMSVESSDNGIKISINVPSKEEE